MSSLLQVRNVPESTKEILKERARAEGKSLNSYVLDILEREAAVPTMKEVLERAGSRKGGVRGSSADLVRAMRAEREEELLRRVRA